MFQAVTATKKIASLDKSIRIIQGGTSASKTISILLLLIDYAQTHEGKLITVASESLPHMKKGALKDFLTIMKSHGYYKESEYNKTDKQYTFPTGTVMEFFGIDDEDKARGPRRDVLFINEANNVNFNTYDQMEVRTREFTFLDFNPTHEFWVHTEVMPHHEHDFLKLTYKDNEALDQKMIEKIEARQYNENWWQVFGLGEIGNLEGLVFQHWEVIDEIPEEARLERRGLDFGFTNDPSVLLDVYKWNNAFILDEQLNATGLSNRHIAEHILELPEALTVADKTEPKSIASIKSKGVWIKESQGGPDSVRQGIDLMQDYKIYITKNSPSTIKDFRNYQWKLDRSGKSLNVPEHPHSHSPDAARYAIEDIVGRNLLTADDFAL